MTSDAARVTAVARESSTGSTAERWTAWSRSLSLVWEPCPRVYDHLSAVIEALQEVFDVESFTVLDGSVRVSLAPGDDVTINVRGLSIATRPEHPDVAHARAHPGPGVVHALFDLLQIRPISAVIFYQHLLPWEGDVPEPEQAFQETAQALMPSVVAETGINDFALLADGQSRSGLRYQFETGVVEDEQVFERISRLLGRVDGPTATSIDHLIDQNFAKLNTFVDTVWHVVPQGEALASASSFAAWLAGAYDVTERESSALAVTLHSLSRNSERPTA